MKLYVSSINEIITKEIAQFILKDAGITKEIDGFSDCKNNCCCHEFKNGLEIRFDLFKRVDNFPSKLRRFFLNPFRNLFIRNPDERFLESHHEVMGILIQENKNKNTIYLFLDKILKANSRIKDILIHELMHIKKPIGHCDNPCCIFYSGYERGINQISLCEDCKETYGEILKEINF